MATSWTVGDWVFVYCEDDEYWYPATIVQIDGEDITIRYDDDESEEEVVSEDYLEDYSTEVGEGGAEAWSDDDECYYAVTITGVKDEQIEVEYEDGSTGTVDLSYLRFADADSET